MVTEPLAPPPVGVDSDAWTAACAAVRAYCGWHVAPSVAEVVTVDGSGSRVQPLPTLRLTALASITNDGAAVTDPEWSSAGMVRAPGCGVWTSRWRGVVATITHGYDECPAEVLDVIKEMVASGGRAGVAAVTNHDHSVTYDASTLDRRQRSVLDLYRRPALA